MSYQDLQSLEEKGGLPKLRKRYKLSPADLLFLKCLVKFVQQGNCHPSQETIEIDTGLPIRTIQDVSNRVVAKRVVGRSMPNYINRHGMECKGKLYHYHFSIDVDLAVLYGDLADTFEEGHFSQESEQKFSQEFLFVKDSSIS